MRKQYHFWPGAQGLDAWDVDRLVELSAGLPVEQVPLGDIAGLDADYWFDGSGQRPTVRRLVEHMRLVQEVDPSYPVVLGADGRVMDGMHRIARALLEGRRSVAAVRFEVQPEPDYRDCDPADLPYPTDADADG